ncbi:MAG: hypothetical protein P1U74_08655 [Legionellaceae bacterium]|nr:hypothetical protein [Legionellaceae bacterium]
MLTIHYLISESTVNILVKLYRKVNACFCIIYGERDIYTNLSKLERTMIDERLYRKITKEFVDNKFFQFTIPAPAPASALEVQRVGDDFEVVIDHYKIPEIKDEILAAADEELLIRNEDRQRIIKLEQELADRKQELADRKQELVDRKIELETQDQVITRLKSIIKDKHHETSELRSQLGEYKVSQYNKSSSRDNQVGLTRNSSHHSTMFSRSGKAGSSSSNDYEQVSDNSI